MSNTLPTLVAGALTNVRNPRNDKDVISAGMIRDLEVGADGKVTLTLVLNQNDPPGLAREQEWPYPLLRESRTWIWPLLRTPRCLDEAPETRGSGHEAAPEHAPPPEFSILARSSLFKRQGWGR